MISDEQKILEEIYFNTFSKKMDFLTKKTADNMYWIRGFLLTPDVAKKWFGEDLICPHCGGTEVSVESMGNFCAFCGLINNLEVVLWKYHIKQLCLLSDIHLILEYYREHKVSTVEE